MKRLTILAILAFMVVFVSPALVKSDPAGPPGGLDVNVKNTPLPVEGIVSVGFRLVGVSDTQVRAHVGFSRMCAACQETFGPRARMCTVEEAMLDPAIGALSADFWNDALVAWVQPTDVDYSWVFDPNAEHPFKFYQFARSAQVGSIRHYSLAVEDQATVDCYGWTRTSAAHNGAVLEDSGSFGVRACCRDAHVLCCAPTQ